MSDYNNNRKGFHSENSDNNETGRESEPEWIDFEKSEDQPSQPVRGSADRYASQQQKNPEIPENRDYHPVRFRRDGKTGCLGGMMFAVFVISVSVILACLGWMAACDVLALNKEELTAQVTVPENYDIDDVADALYDAGIIDYKFLFKIFSSISDADEKIDPGTYELSTELDYRAIVTTMQTGSVSQLVTTIMIPEGYTMQQIFETLEEKKICSVDDLYEAAANFNYDYRFLEGTEQGDASRLEGFLFPDTYDFYQGEQASSVISKFLSNFYQKYNADMYQQAENLGLTIQEVITIASMIEKEAANNDERATIASVIYNRLKSDMMLQIDATIQYILPERKPILSLDDLEIDSPYNTYMYTGLPPGPISNPGLASIVAALQPDSTNYYYYALDTETNSHKFFTNYDDHQAFVATQDYGA